jgi:hypothetical protein
VAAGEFAYLSGAINPKDGAAFHGRGDHYAVRERICRCLATDGADGLAARSEWGAELAVCVHGRSPRSQEQHDEL